MVDDYIAGEARPQAGRISASGDEDVLEETHGVMVYQEQVMRILNRLGGIELANAYTCIKAISKKKLEMIAKFREAVHRRGPRARAWTRRRPRNCSGMIEKFAGYGFNKMHIHGLRADRLQTAYSRRITRSSSWRRCCRATFRAATSRRRIRWSSIWKIAGGWK